MNKAFLEKLRCEIERVKSEEERAKQMERLREIYRVYAGEDLIVPFSDIAERIKSEGDEKKYMTNWKGLDEIIKGFRRQQLVVVSALTKSGKTSFCMDMTMRLAELNPVWFPFEESAEELIRKFIERGEEPPHAFTPSVMKGNTLEWIEERVIEAIAKYDSKMAVIDHIDFVVPFNADNHALRVGQAMRGLKAVAKRWNILIFLICHLVKAKMDNQPTLEDLRGSSSIAQEADTVILLWRESKRIEGRMEITDNVNVSVQANRRTGKTGNVKMKYENGHLLESAWVSVPESEVREVEIFKNF